MGEVILKQAIPLSELQDVVKLKLPRFAGLIKIDNQYEALAFWYSVSELEGPTEERSYRVVGTGHEITTDKEHYLDYIDTIQFKEGSLVFHVFEIKEVPF